MSAYTFKAQSQECMVTVQCSVYNIGLDVKYDNLLSPQLVRSKFQGESPRNICDSVFEYLYKEVHILLHQNLCHFCHQTVNLPLLLSDICRY